MCVLGLVRARLPLLLTPPALLRRAQAPELAGLRSSLAQMSEQLAATQSAKAELAAQLAALKSTQATQEEDRARRKNVSKEAEVAELRRTLDALSVDNKQKTAALKTAEEGVSRLEAQVREQTAAGVRSTKERNQLHDKLRSWRR